MKADTVISLASSQVGITEYPPNSNNVIYNTWYYGKEVSGADFPWCCTFISWLFKGTNIVKKSASCMYLGQWFKDNKRFYNEPKVGDIAFFKFSTNSRWTNHVGIVIKVNGDIVTTIEGNTSADNKGSQDNGGMVAIRTRNKKNIVGYGRPKYEDEIIDNGSYYPRYVGSTVSITDALKSVGENDVSLDHRSILFEINGGKGEYKGTSEQNTFLLTRLKNGILKRL